MFIEQKVGKTLKSSEAGCLKLLSLLNSVLFVYSVQGQNEYIIMH